MVILRVHSVTVPRHYILFTWINQIRLHSTAAANFQPRVAAVNLTRLKASGFDSGICFTARYITFNVQRLLYRPHKNLCNLLTIYEWPMCCWYNDADLIPLVLTALSNTLRPVTSELITAGHDAVSLRRFGTKTGLLPPFSGQTRDACRCVHLQNYTASHAKHKRATVLWTPTWTKCAPSCPPTPSPTSLRANTKRLQFTEAVFQHEGVNFAL